MNYAQLNKDGSFGRQITEQGDVVWGPTCQCPASKLTPAERIAYRVVELYETSMPAFDPITQVCVRDGGEFVGGRWQYKWLVSDVSPEQAQANAAAAQSALIARYTAALDAHIDAVAKADRWDSRITACLASGFPNPWQERAKAFADWTYSQCYPLGYQIMADVQAGKRALPTIEEFLAEMPVMEWPK